MSLTKEQEEHIDHLLDLGLFEEGVTAIRDLTTHGGDQTADKVRALVRCGAALAALTVYNERVASELPRAILAYAQRQARTRCEATLLAEGGH